MGSRPLLEIIDLKTYFATDEGLVKAVDGVSFSIEKGETLSIVGESGSGKSVTSLSVMRLVPVPGYIAGGRILFEGQDLVKKTEKEMRNIRGNSISMISQDPMTSLNPVYTVGNQIAETIVLHQKKSWREAMRKAGDMLELVGIPDPGKRLNNFPHQMSGGMRQRVMIAMALCCNPKMLIADEPTTALDVTIQAQILDLMRELQKEIGMAILFITHDLGVVAELSDNIVVMYGGRAVEAGPVETIFEFPQMPYTVGLIQSIPRIDLQSEVKLKLRTIPGVVPNPRKLPLGCSFQNRCTYVQHVCRESIPPLTDIGAGHLVRCARHQEIKGLLADELHSVDNFPESRGTSRKHQEALLEVEALQKFFPIRGGVFSRVVGYVQAVNNVPFQINRGEVVGMVGESGSGKTTVGRTILRLIEPTSGGIRYNGVDLSKLSRKQMRKYRKEIQIIFQDPYASLDMRMTVGKIVGEGIDIHRMMKGKKKEQRIIELLESVGLSKYDYNKYPHQFSGGQRQRIGIARALAVEPKLIIADEPVSALDVSIQAQVLNLLYDLKEEFNLTLLFIAHDLSVVQYISDRVIVMYLGKIMEIAPSRNLYGNPVHPYTVSLLSAIPIPDPKRKSQRMILQGDIPSPINPPSGCVFRTRCPIAEQICSSKEPPLEMISEGHYKACHLRPL